MRTLNNHKQVLIGKNIDVTVSGTPKATPSTVADGELVVTDLSGTVLNSTTVAGKDKIVIVQGRGATNPLLVSAPITLSGIRTYKGKVYGAAAAQVDYIGFNAATATGSFDVINNNPYIVRASLKSNFSNYADKEMHVIGDYVSTSSATQALVAAGLCKSLIENSEKFPNVPFKVERVHSDAGAAIGAAADTVVGVKGSKTVTLTDTGGDTSLSAIAAGDYIRFGTAVTSPVYKIVSTTVAGGATGTVTLDLPLQADVSLLGTTAEFITAALAAAGDFGIKLTGKTKTFKEGVWRYEAMKWFTTIANGGSTPVANATAASEGVNTYEQVAEAEWFYQLAEGFADNMTIQIPPVTFRKDAVSTANYSSIDLEWSDAGGTDILHNPVSHKQLTLYCDKASTAGNWQFTKAATGIVTILDAWISALDNQTSNV